MEDRSLSFPQAISSTQNLMEQIANNQINEAEIEQQITSIIRDKKGGRGFFVSYLTSKLALADNPSQGVINALQSSSDIVDELLVKNLAMSSAMIISHDRNQDPENVAGSQKVYQRTNNLIQRIQSKSLEDELQKLKTTIEEGSGDYQGFLERWAYDLEQKQAIKNAAAGALNPKN